MRKKKPMSFEDLLKELQDQKAAEGSSSERSLEKLFNERFMSEHSSFSSFQAFLEKGNFQAWSEEDMNHIPEELLNRHVARETNFEDWPSMLASANQAFQQ